MAESVQQQNVGIVLDGLAAQRFVERLSRAGLPAHLIAPESLTQAQAGQVYLASSTLAMQAEAATHRGAHVCLIPPWPGDAILIGAVSVGVAEAGRRGLVRITSSLARGAPDGQVQPLRILYREKLVGAFSFALATSETGEPLLAVLPRDSNRNGHLLVTSLQVSAASAQTQPGDVGWLIRRIAAWSVAHTEPKLAGAPLSGEISTIADPGEEVAPLLVLALALALQHPHPAHPATTTPMVVEQVRYRFRWICETLGLTVAPDAFDIGWSWLVAHGVVSPLTDATETAIHTQAVERYCVIWQLGPRLRRLSRLAQAGGGMQTGR